MLDHDGTARGSAGVLFGVVAGGGLSLFTLDWRTGRTWDLLWTIAVIAAVTVALGATGLLVGRRKKQMLTKNGTAFMIREQAAGMSADDQMEDYDREVRRRFVAVFNVPGAVELNQDWNWPLDERAAQWDDKVRDVTRSFQSLYLGALDEGSAAGVMIWAWWPVAVAVGTRLRSADRFLRLSVWQRPSEGHASGGRQAPVKLLTQGPHEFDEDSLSVAGGGHFERLPEVSVSVSVGRRRGARGGVPPVAILLLMLTGDTYGPLGTVGDLGGNQGRLRDLRIVDTADLGLAKAPSIGVRALRICPPSGQKVFAWQAFPALAGECVRWIEQKRDELADHTLLLGARIPQEVALGLGISSGREAHHESWPRSLWPAVFDRGTGQLVVPRLELGTDAMGRGH